MRKEGEAGGRTAGAGSGNRGRVKGGREGQGSGAAERSVTVEEEATAARGTAGQWQLRSCADGGGAREPRPYGGERGAAAARLTATRAGGRARGPPRPPARPLAPTPPPRLSPPAPAVPPQPLPPPPGEVSLAGRVSGGRLGSVAQGRRRRAGGPAPPTVGGRPGGVGADGGVPPPHGRHPPGRTDGNAAGRGNGAPPAPSALPDDREPDRVAEHPPPTW